MNSLLTRTPRVRRFASAVLRACPPSFQRWVRARMAAGELPADRPIVAAVAVSPEDAAPPREPVDAPLDPAVSDYDERIAREQQIFSVQANLQELPAIYSYWSNRYLRPVLESLGYSYPEDFFAREIARQRDRLGRPLRIVSLGCGDGESEVAIARLLLDRGYGDFHLECFDLNPDLLERVARRADEAQLGGRLSCHQGDFNRWRPERAYDVVIANQSLHHVVELEHLFDAIREAIGAQGRFLTSDMIGRNGHRRWPEAMAIVHEYWRELAPERRYNLQLQRHEELYMDWDCSKEGFEGIRAQDILPLLLERFGFETFIGFGNIIDPFIDRAFGHHLDARSPEDRAFIDRVHARDDAELRAGTVKPTHMLAVLCADRTVRSRVDGVLTPEFCVRRP